MFKLEANCLAVLPLHCKMRRLSYLCAKQCAAQPRRRRARERERARQGRGIISLRLKLFTFHFIRAKLLSNYRQLILFPLSQHDAAGMAAPAAVRAVCRLHLGRILPSKREESARGAGRRRPTQDQRQLSAQHTHINYNQELLE